MSVGRKPSSRFGASLVECMLVVAVTGIVLSATNTAVVSISKLNRQMMDNSANSEVRHVELRELRRAIHLARNVELVDLANRDEIVVRSEAGRDLRFSLKRLQGICGWQASGWRVTSEMVEIVGGVPSKAHVLFRAARGLASTRRLGLPSAVTQTPPSSPRLPPLEMLPEVEVVP